jgi:hypothetical protein
MKQPILLTLTGITITALVIGLFAPATAVLAQNTPSGGQALEIAPPVINLTADPGETVTTKISLRDISSTDLLVRGQVNDFVASGEDGTPKILLDEGEANPFSMKSWFEDLPSLTLKPRQIENLPVTINVPADAAPGGYYAVVRFTATPPELEDTGVSLSASLGALVLLRINGQAKEGLTIEEFSATKDHKATAIFESSPVPFTVRLKNTGTVHEQPAGQITVTDMFGKKVGTVNVNLPPRNILPQSIRKFEQSLDSSVIGNKPLFGRYTAELKVTYGTNQPPVTKTIDFWVIPYRLIGIAIVVLLAAFFGLRFMIRRYNRHIIKQAQKRR